VKAARLRGAAFALLVLAGGVQAEPLVVGASMPPIAVESQHGQAVSITPATRKLIFAADKAAGDLATSVLAPEPAGVLDRLNAVYLADISGMPAFVTRMFALPKMRELPFAVGLVRDAAVTADLPRQPGEVTVVDIDQGRAVQIRSAADAAALRKLLGL
jgi:hypothetical protein